MEPYIFQALMGALLFGIGAMFFKWNVQINGDDNIFFAVLYGTGAICFFIGGFGDFTELTAAHYISGALIGLGAAGGNYFFSKGLRHGPAGLTSAFCQGKYCHSDFNIFNLLPRTADINRDYRHYMFPCGDADCKFENRWCPAQRQQNMVCVDGR